MFRTTNFIKAAAVLAIVVGTSTLFGVSSANAMQMPVELKDGISQNTQPNSDIPLEIIPVCSDAEAMTSKWTVTNKNVNEVKLDWNNIENDHSGTFQAVNGQSTLITYFNPADPNNRTVFNYSGNESSTNAQVAPCTPVVPPVDPTPCVDGTDAQMLQVSTITRDATKAFAGVSVITKDGGVLCDDVTLYFSSYTMPDTYDGKGFENNPTAYPQRVFASISVTIKKGTNGASTLLVALPDFCKNIQVDLYYAPEITTVGQNGHGTQNILGQIYNSEGSCTPDDCGEGNGGGTTTPPVVNPPVTPPTTPPATGNGGGAGNSNEVKPVAATVPAELPHTGGPSNIALIYAIILSFITYFVAYMVQPKRISK